LLTGVLDAVRVLAKRAGEAEFDVQLLIPVLPVLEPDEVRRLRITAGDSNAVPRRVDVWLCA
jgi:hypothetical protein